MKHLTMQDRKMMRYMGYTHKVYFYNRKGIPFSSYFSSEAEMASFITKAENAGTTVDTILKL